MLIKAALRVFVAALLLAAVPVIADAQTGNPAGAPPLPVAVLMAAVDGKPAEMAALRRYFEESASPEDVIDRLGLLLSPLDGPTVVAVADLVINEARAALSAAHVVRLAVDPSFVPKDAVVAFDFGAPGTAAAPGFERVAPGDARLTGELATRQVGNERGIQADGISGLKQVKFKVPNGDAGPYRILIATRALPDQSFPNSYFGAQVTINGVVSQIRQQSPDQWTSLAMLGEPSAGELNALPNGEMLRTATFSQSRLDDAARQQGGAIVIEAYAVNGEIDIQLPSAAPTFLTALIVERADRPSGFALTPEARDKILPLEARLTLEEQIQIMVASLLEKVEPAVGEPVFPPDITASPS